MISTTITAISSNISNSTSVIFNEKKEEINSLYYIPGTTLLNTEWGQWKHYNSKCPMNWCEYPRDDPYHCRLGCISVAIGQIINFYRIQSKNSISYICSKDCIIPKTIENDFNDQDYDWSQMVNKLHDGSSDEQKDNVSTLLYDVATIIEKDFGTGSYFTFYIEDDEPQPDFMIAMLYYAFNDIDFSSTIWDYDLIESEIKNEINNNRPIMFYMRCLSSIYKENLGGKVYHATVIDGYQYKQFGSRNKFQVHINYGWNGVNNDWYNYTEIFPGDPDEDYDYDDINFREALLIRVEKNDEPPEPPEINGQIYGSTLKSYNFTAKTRYEVSPPIYYKFDWGDGTSTDWLGEYRSDEICYASHKWKDNGIYQVKARLKDGNGLESNWSDPLIVIMPKIYIHYPIIELIMKIWGHFPLFEKILNQII